MVEFDVIAREAKDNEQLSSRALTMRAIRTGKMPGLNEIVQARGAVLRERENSILSDAWMPLTFLLLTIGLIAGRYAPILAIGFCLLLIVGVGSWWKRTALVAVTYERSFDQTHVFPDEPITMTLIISNQKPLPLTWLQFRDELPVAPEDTGQLSVIASEITGTHHLQTTISMNGFERARKSVRLRFSKRGYYKIGPVQYQSGDVFTLYTIQRVHHYIHQLVIYPRVWPLQALELPAREMFGELKIRRSLFTDPVRAQGIRDYQPQDRFRDVHWKATARRGDLQTKVYEPMTGLSVVVFLNVATLERHWLGHDPELLERAVSVSASIASYAAEQKWSVGLIANGSVPGSDQPIRVAPGRSAEQLMKILEALAAVTEFATGSIELLMHRESARLSWSSTFVLVTGIVTDEIVVNLVRLKEAGRRITLISLAEEPPSQNVSDILTYHVPGTTPAFRQLNEPSTLTEASLGSVVNPDGPPQAYPGKSPAVP